MDSGCNQGRDRSRPVGEEARALPICHHQVKRVEPSKLPLGQSEYAPSPESTSLTSVPREGAPGSGKPYPRRLVTAAKRTCSETPSQDPPD